MAPESGDEKRAWYTSTAHVLDMHPLAWANRGTGSALGLYVPKAKPAGISQMIREAAIHTLRKTDLLLKYEQLGELLSNLRC